MTLFLVTDDEANVDYAAARLGEIVGSKAQVKPLESGLTLVVAGPSAVSKDLADGSVTGVGTFFNRSGFHKEALDPVEDTGGLLNMAKEGLFGHFVFIVEQGNQTLVIPDKVGMINVFYSMRGGRSYVSNDPALVTALAFRFELCQQAVNEFVLTEATLGSETLFRGVRRVQFGNCLEIKGSPQERSIHTYEAEHLSFSDYAERIRRYFRALNTYDGVISADLSAGFDTRTVVAAGHASVDGLEANVNTNRFDRGVDEAVAPEVSRALGVSLSIIERDDGYAGDDDLMLHRLALGRDMIRSSQWPRKMEKKYDKFDLILGGYGGEAIRAKYNDYTPFQYYKGQEAEGMLNDPAYAGNLRRKLARYPAVATNDQPMNFLYVADRMRIWGGASVNMALVYGDNLHPFMDWHLINPIFSLEPRRLVGGEYQLRIIEHFAPSLREIPVNEFMEDPLVSRLARKVQALLARMRRSASGRELERRLDQLPEDFRDTFDEEIDTLQARGGRKNLTRFMTVGFAQAHARTEANEAARPQAH